MDKREQEDYRRIRQDDIEIRLLRPYGKIQQTFTGRLRM